MPGKRSRSDSVGSQVAPSGGPNFAQVASSLTMAVVVNLASSECEAASGVVVKARKPKSMPIPFSLRSKSWSQARSRSDGWNTALNGRPVVEGIVSRRTSRSFGLLQPQ